MTSIGRHFQAPPSSFFLFDRYLLQVVPGQPLP